MSRLFEEIDGKVKAFLERPIEGDWPYLWIDATYRKVRRGEHIVSVAAIIAVGVNTEANNPVNHLPAERTHRLKEQDHAPQGQARNAAFCTA